MHTAAVTALAGALMAGAPRLPSAQAQATDSVAVANVVRQFHDALARRDSGAALALLAEDVVVLESGGIESRAEYRSHHLAADMQFAAAVHGHTGPLHVVISGDAAWVTSTTDVTGTAEGRAINNTSAELMVLTRTQAGWRIRAVHWSSRRRPNP